jgi:hypothetical protein
MVIAKVRATEDRSGFIEKSPPTFHEHCVAAQTRDQQKWLPHPGREHYLEKLRGSKFAITKIRKGLLPPT